MRILLHILAYYSKTGSQKPVTEKFVNPKYKKDDIRDDERCYQQ